MKSNNANPVLVEVTRGDMVESVHRGSAIVIDASGLKVASFGDVDHHIYPRSAIKPLQAIVLAESGAIDHYGLGSRQLALACASHSGETIHTEGVRNWLAKLGLNETDLECGTHPPAHRETRLSLTRENSSATPIHNNCSGKHAGFLTVARYCGESTAGYIERGHPVQQRVLEVLQDVTGESVATAPAGIDGCGIPVYGMTLTGIARAFAALAGSRFESSKRREASKSICQAMAKHPELVGGTGRLCSAVPLATERRVIVKVGAEGVYAGFVLGENPLGLALKIDDGSRRAAEVAVSWLVSKFCSLDAASLERLQPWLRPAVKTVAKKSAGVIRPAIEL